MLFLTSFVLLLLMKLKLGHYSPTLYWSTLTASAIGGTAITDYIDPTLGLGYLLGSSLLVLMLIITLTVWYIKEGSLSVESIRSNSAESFY